MLVFMQGSIAPGTLALMFLCCFHPAKDVHGLESNSLFVYTSLAKKANSDSDSDSDSDYNSTVCLVLMLTGC